MFSFDDVIMATAVWKWNLFMHVDYWYNVHAPFPPRSTPRSIWHLYSCRRCLRGVTVYVSDVQVVIVSTESFREYLETKTLQRSQDFKVIWQLALIYNYSINTAAHNILGQKLHWCTMKYLLAVENILQQVQPRQHVRVEGSPLFK